MDQGRHPDPGVRGEGQEIGSPATQSERDRLAPRLANLRRRAHLLRAIREFFDDLGYLEVDTPALVPSPGLEVHLSAFRAGPGFLNTSPEYQMKRLLAGGLERIYQVCHVFRDDERGAHHLREFTLLEWYRVGADLESLMDETEALGHHVSQAVGSRAAVDLTPPWERLSTREALRRHAGLDWTAHPDAGDFAAAARAAGVTLTTGPLAWDDVFLQVLVDRVEPALGRESPCLLHGWPPGLAALSRLSEDRSVARRFELYAGGLELANAFEELTDPIEQRRRFAHDLAERQARGLPLYPPDERFLAALEEGIPLVSGIALGVDRLVMLLSDARTIDEVVPFTPEDLVPGTQP